jgi:tetratricopeptide (TPR) repeat protein
MRLFRSFKASAGKRCRIAMTIALMSAVVSPVCIAAPYVPESDATPLERLATSPAFVRERQEDAALRLLLKRDPNNVVLAVRAAERYVARSRRESDPRLLGQAQAALAPWWTQPEAPAPVMLIRATILQSNHDFTNAQRDLEFVVKRNPDNAQAWLTLATAQQVTGDLAAAERSCKKLHSLTQPIVAVTCSAGVDGMRGRARQAYEAINATVGATEQSAAPIGVQTWAITLQAELAERLGLTNDAERLYRKSLALDPADTYAIGAYADFLIDANRPLDVLSLIPANTRADILLLRRAIAAKAAVAADAEQTARVLGERFAASRARGDRVHLREESRYALLIAGNAKPRAIRNRSPASLRG